MSTIRVHFDGKVFVPDEPVDLPAGTPGEFRAARARAAAMPTTNSLVELAKLAETFPDTDLPPDAAAQHDHYLYGQPKRP
jgi:hypothetical protein